MPGASSPERYQGAALAGGSPAGAAAGAVGAVLGTLGSAWARGRLAAAFKKDWPAAVLEDLVAVGGAAALVLLAR